MTVEKLCELIRSLADGRWEVRAEAAQLLGTSCDFDAASALLWRLRVEENSRVRALMEAALAQIGIPERELVRREAAFGVR